MKYFDTILLLLATLGVCLNADANDTYSIRQISNRDGLSNSAVICLFQDKERCLWAGTYDGLNRYNGAEIKRYKPDIKNQYSISGNVIRRVVESKEDYLWIMTKGGLNRYSKKRDRIEAYYNEYPEDCAMTCDSQGNLFTMTQTGQLFNFDFIEQKFNKIDVPDFNPTKSWVSLIIDTNDKVWITNDGTIRQYAIDSSDSRRIKLIGLGDFKHPEAITDIFYSKGSITFVDRAADLYILKFGKKTFIRNIRSIIKEYGGITSIVLDGEDVIIGFATSGVIALDCSDGYATRKFPINCGVFSLLKDDVQDILWVGTDGQGIYACVKDRYIFKGINLKELPLKTQRPVRALFSDHLGQLWLGTKGNGVIKIDDYENATEYDGSNVSHWSVENGLSNDAVFSFEMSHANNILWIGSSGPELNYYSFDDKKIHTLKSKVPVSFVEVHSMLETSANTLWVASQFSLLKVDIHKTADRVEARDVRRYEFDIKYKQLFNKIYSIHRQNDSIIWLAIRGNGAIRFNTNNGKHRLITFEQNGITPMNDILSIHIDKNREIWLGSSYGINNLKEQSDGTFIHHNYNENDGLANNTIHGILENQDGKLWVSSNTGLILFDPIKKSSHNFTHKSGLKVVEFSDNAYYKDEAMSKYFFGGIDGVVWIEHGEKKKREFVPPIYFTTLRILNNEVNIDDFMVQNRGKKWLRLKHNQNFFSVSFSTNDFIEGANIKFAYKLENFNEVWTSTGLREAQFTNIPPGEYLLKVRYGNESEQENTVEYLNIKILPPWYLSLCAKLLYVIAIALVIFRSYIHLTKKYERENALMVQQLEQKYKVEMYENKLRFFTNITHEFCTPLTLIHTPSERILNYEGSDSFVKKYAGIIKSNAERLNNLIQEIIDWRRMETGNKICVIERCDINKICSEIVDAFTDLAEENNINFSLDIDNDIFWNSDRNGLITILNNLVSNAFKYTPANGSIAITVATCEKELVIRVYNSGKGIRQEDIPYVFNRYSVMDNIKENSIKGLSSRNGLGLAICMSLIELLEGSVDINSEVGKYAEFVIKLPVREMPQAQPPQTEQQQVTADIAEVNKRTSVVDTQRIEQDGVQALDERPEILIVDDNQEMLWILKDILSEDYHISTATDGEQGFEQLTNRMPDLVMTDIMMPNQDGISMTKRIKLNPHTVHIPIIIVSAKVTIDDKIEGISSGADSFITKPFDTQYLKTMVKHLIEKHKKLKEYYNSAASSFDYMNGHLMSKEDRDFIQAVINMIERNISDTEFSPEDLAANLSVSLRSIYRRFKDMGLPSPNDFIKKQRIEYSAKMLLSTNITIQEIMYSAGFTTRSHFHNEFIKRFGQSPREYREQHSADFS